MKDWYNIYFLDYFTKNIKYSEQLEKNYFIEYLLFNILFLEENLYLCDYKNNDFFIINDISLQKTIKYPVLIFNLNSIFE
jgi:hypothetical protein